MSTPARRRATYQDVLDAPPDRIAEVVDGELHLTRPRLPHSYVASSLNALLVTRFQDDDGIPGDWIFLIEPELHFGDDILVPDLAGWRIERLPVVGNDRFATLAPDWVCEILSRSTENFDRDDKLPIYAAQGVTHTWLIHPIRRTLEVLRLHRRTWLPVATYRDEQRVRAEPFDAIELDLGRLWRRLAPSGDRACEPSATYKHGGVYIHDEELDETARTPSVAVTGWSPAGR